MLIGLWPILGGLQVDLFPFLFKLPEGTHIVGFWAPSPIFHPHHLSSPWPWSFVSENAYSESSPTCSTLQNCSGQPIIILVSIYNLNGPLSGEITVSSDEQSVYLSFLGLTELCFRSYIHTAPVINLAHNL